jgi:hypothetical protein
MDIITHILENLFKGLTKLGTRERPLDPQGYLLNMYVSKHLVTNGDGILVSSACGCTESERRCPLLSARSSPVRT